MNLQNVVKDISVDLIDPARIRALRSELGQSTLGELRPKEGYIVKSVSDTLRIITKCDDHTGYYSVAKIDIKTSAIETGSLSYKTPLLPLAAVYKTDSGFRDNLVKSLQDPKACQVLTELLRNRDALTPVSASLGKERTHCVYLNNILGPEPPQLITERPQALSPCCTIYLESGANCEASIAFGWANFNSDTPTSLKPPRLSHFVADASIRQADGYEQLLASIQSGLNCFNIIVMARDAR